MRYGLVALAALLSTAAAYAAAAMAPSLGDIQEWAAQQPAERAGLIRYTEPMPTPPPHTIGFDDPLPPQHWLAKATFGWSPHGEKLSFAYDPVHRLVFYSRGCCTNFQRVFELVTSPPPRHLATEDLSRLTTVKGIGIGASADAVLRSYGKALLRSSGGATRSTR